MKTSFPQRRRFLQTTAAGGLAWGLGDLGFLSSLPSVSAEEAHTDPRTVTFQPDIEPVVRLIEDTPRERLLEEVAHRIRHHGLSYREVLAGLLLAGIRNVEPRPSVGFKFHAVLVVNSAHLASLSSPDSDRWLPIFWALDEFKSSQSRDVEEGNWTMGAVDESKVPNSAAKARQAFTEAMDHWDVEAADTAVAGLARTTGAQEIFELFARYGARDFRSIGHKAIYVANSWRTLQCIGWQHAEPVLRSLAYALLNHHGEPNPSQNDLAPDQPWRENEKLVAEMAPDWQGGSLDDDATRHLLDVLREGSPSDACQAVVEHLGRGCSPQSLYDAMLVGSGELLMRQPGIVALHAVTSANALHFAYQTTGNDHTRRMLLLQNAAFLPLFREAMKGRGGVAEARVDQLEGLESQGIEDIFHDVSQDRGHAARKVLAYLDEGSDPKPLMDAARRLIFLKGTNSHDYKFSSAVLEDFFHVSPAWRNRFLATSVFSLRGSGGGDNQLVQRTRQALQT